MKSRQHIENIRKELEALESGISAAEDKDSVKNWDALELPDLVASVIDFLQPLLLPYESAIYWHLFRKALLGQGTQYVRVSVRGMQDVVKSSSGQSSSLSYSSVQKALQGLEDKGVIEKHGDTNREGTLYKVMLPDEITECASLRKKKAEESIKPIDEKKELDFYNVAENRLKVFERDDYKCTYCRKQLTRFTATLDHIQPVSQGGNHSFDNLVTACLHCNSRRGSRPVMDRKTEVEKSDA